MQKNIELFQQIQINLELFQIIEEIVVICIFQFMICCISWKELSNECVERGYRINEYGYERENIDDIHTWSFVPFGLNIREYLKVNKSVNTWTWVLYNERVERGYRYDEQGEEREN